MRFYAESADLVNWAPADPAALYWTGPDERDPPYTPGGALPELYNLDATPYESLLELLASGLDVRGLAHITGDGLLNLARLEADVGYRIDGPLPVPPVFGVIASRASVPEAEMWEVFNMGCGFCVVVPAGDAAEAVSLLAARHPGTNVIGEATDNAGLIELTRAGLAGRRDEGFRPT